VIVSGVGATHPSPASIASAFIRSCSTAYDAYPTQPSDVSVDSIPSTITLSLGLCV
jgi:hypothetical protein